MTNNKEEIQQKNMELHLIEQQMQQVQKQLQLLEQQLHDLNNILEAIGDISKSKPGTEILVPMSSGIFIKAGIKDNKDFIVNVGSDVAVKKSAEETKKLIKEQETEIKKFQQELKANLEKLASKAAEIEKELSELIK